MCLTHASRTVGIDVGKDSFVVAFHPTEPKTPPRQYPTMLISYDDPRWWVSFLDLIDPAAVIAAEPTGAHLLAPIAAVINTYRPDAQLWQCDGKLTEHYRETRISSAKNDRLDSIALCLVAADIAAGTTPRNCRPFDHAAESQTQALRLQINIYARLNKERTRTLNRINVLAHSLFPAFTRRFDTWLRAVRSVRAVTPIQIKTLADAQPPPPAYIDGRARRPLQILAADLPDISTEPALTSAILELVAHLDSLEIQLAERQAVITHLIDQPPFNVATRRWRTVPNANDIAIATVHVATLGNALNFERDAFCSAVGTSPKTSTSGDKDRTSASRKGYRPVRAALHMWTVGLVSPTAPNNSIRRFYDKEKHNFPACRNKLARKLWGVARDASLDPKEN